MGNLYKSKAYPFLDLNFAEGKFYSPKTASNMLMTNSANPNSYEYSTVCRLPDSLTLLIALSF